VRKKLIVIVGPTASGKSNLAVEVALRLSLTSLTAGRSGQARRIGGEIVSADSRQVYRGMDIGSGKVTQREMRGVPHHLLDVAHPGRTFTVAHYQKRALAALRGIWKRERIPIICGGTGLYVRSVVDGLVIPDVKPNAQLRKKLERRTTEQLYAELAKHDRARAATIDRHNRRRLIRALEVVAARGFVPPLTFKPIDADVLVIGIKRNTTELAELIRSRLLRRLRSGMVGEIRDLHEWSGISWKRLEGFGLEYRHVARFLEGKVSRERMVEELVRDIVAYAKRQMTWFRRDTRTVWVSRPAQALPLVRAFLRTK
jgi:tRNA dimethylallyltransferase